MRRTVPSLAAFNFQYERGGLRDLWATVCALETFTEGGGAPGELTRSRRDLAFPGFIGKFRDRAEIE